MQETIKIEKKLNGYISVTKLSKRLGKETKEILNILSDNGWIKKSGSYWEMTELGRKKGGELKTDKENGNSWIVWPPETNFDEIFSKILQEKRSKLLTARNIAESFKINKERVNLILSELGWIKKELKGWILTEIGETMGGEHFEHEKTGIPFVCWPKNILENPILIESINQTLHENTSDTIVEVNYRQKFDSKNRATDGHYVKSRGEMIIDNWLYMSEIVHAYERKLPIEEDVYSDFYLPHGKVYIEYWGLDEDVKYIERKKVKIEIYKKYNFKLIELTNKDLENLDDVLPKKLLKYNIAIF